MRRSRIDAYVPAGETTGDLVHRFYQEQVQIDGGRMDKFAAISDASGLVMGYYNLSQSAHWRLAKEFALADRMFHSAFGGSMLNHTFLVCSCAFVWPNAPEEIVAKVDADGKMLEDGQVSPDGYVVNTGRSVFLHAPTDTDPARLVPPQTMPHIGDRLDAKGVGWAWYAGGYDDAVAGRPDPKFQPSSVAGVFSEPGTGNAGTAGASQGPEGSLRRHRARQSAAGRLLQADRPAQFASRLRQHHRWRRSSRQPAEEPALWRHADHYHLRRERRLLGPRPAAGPRPLGTGDAHPADRRRPHGQARLRRSHHLRLRRGPRDDRGAVRPRATDRRRRQGGVPAQHAEVSGDGLYAHRIGNRPRSSENCARMLRRWTAVSLSQRLICGSFAAEWAIEQLLWSRRSSP